MLVTVLTGILLSWHSLGDLDIWFHLRAGRDLLGGQGITAVNHYSFTEPDHPWVNHEWMFQVLTSVTGPKSSPEIEIGSEPVVTGWHLMRSALTLILLLTILFGDGGRSRLLGRDGPQAAVWSGIPVLAGLMLLWPRLTIRPELFSYLFLVILVRWAEQVFRLTRTGTRDEAGTTGRLILLTVIWAQFHGFASLAPLVLLLCALLAPLQARLHPGTDPRDPLRPSFSRAAVLVLLVLFALIITPNGWNGLLMPLRAVGQFSQAKVDLRTTISELVPLLDSPNSLGLTITAYRISLVWGLVWIVATWGRVSLLRILVFVLAGLAAWTNQRGVGIYAVAFMLLHTGAGANPWRFSQPDRFFNRRPLATAIAGLAVSLIAAFLLWPQIVRDDFYLREGVSRRFGAGLNPAHYPVKSAAAMKQQDTRRYFANLGAAAFLMAHTPGQNFIDGRTEAYSTDLWAEYLRIKRGDEKSLEHLADRSVDAVCLATGNQSFDQLAVRLLEAPAWDLVTAEGAALLFRPASVAQGHHGQDPVPPRQRILSEAASRVLDSAGRGSATRRADLFLAAGRLYMFAGNDEQREAAYRRGLTLKPEHPTLNHNLGNLLLARESFAEALPHFQDALAENGRLAGSALNAGVCQMRLGQAKEAAESFRRATAIDPAKFEAWVNLSAALLRSGDRTGAIRSLEKAIDLRPGDRYLQQRLHQLRSGNRG